MKPVNSYLAKQKAKSKVQQDASRQTFEQYTWDCLCLVLNDPAVMGKDVFGADRLFKVWTAWTEAYHKWFDVLLMNDLTDATRTILDERLQAILGDRFTPFYERYSWMPKTLEEKMNEGTANETPRQHKKHKRR